MRTPGKRIKPQGFRGFESRLLRKMKASTKQAIAEYYDYALPWYRIYHGSSNGIHFGYHDKTTKNYIDEIINTNRVLAKVAKIKKTDLILDAGCGIGGSSIWLVQNYGSKVVGITISPKQLEKAKELAKKAHVENKTEFHLMDFTETKFKNNTFDVVWALESVCYTEYKIDFLKEAHRILKKGGRLILHDGFLKREPKTDQEKRIMQRFYKGFRLDNIATVDSFRKDMIKVGFKKIRCWDKKEDTMSSLIRIHTASMIAYPFVTILEKLHFLPSVVRENADTGMAVYDGVKLDLDNIFLFYGEK